MKRWIQLMIALGMVFLTPGTAWAQEGSPPGEGTFLSQNPDGTFSLNLENLTPIGQVTVPIAEYHPDIPTFEIHLPTPLPTIVIGELVYNEYVTPAGEYVVVPNLATAAVMAMSDASPFNVDPDQVLLNGGSGIAAALGLLENAGVSSEAVRAELQETLAQGLEVSPLEVLQFYWSVLNPNSSLAGDGLFLLTGAWVFSCDPFNPADCAAEAVVEATPAVLPPRSDVACPAPAVVQGEIRVTGELLDPPYPVVVGQDPARRGADLRWQVEILPTTYAWYERRVIGEDIRCVFDPHGTSAGCPGPGSRYEAVIGSQVGWRSWMGEGSQASYWRVEGTGVRVECIAHTEVYSESVSWVRAHANLGQDSRAWVTGGGLQQRYPGASLYQPDWMWMTPPDGSFLGDRSFVWEFVNEGIRFRDPGQYSSSVSGSTTGTPVTAPRVFNLPATDFSVWLLEATLSQ